MSGINLNKISYDEGLDDANVLAIVSDDLGNRITSTDLGGGTRALDVNQRDIDYTTDSIQIIDAAGHALDINVDGSLSAVVTATNLDIRDLVYTQDSVQLGGNGNVVFANVNNELLVHDANVLSELQSLTATIYAEDAPHTSTDSGQFMLAVRNDTEGTLVDANGDYAPLQVDSLGRLRVIADVDVSGDEMNSHKVSAQTVGVAASELVATPLTNRRKIMIQNRGTDSIYIGPDNTVTTATGIEIPKKNSYGPFELTDSADVWAISPSAGMDVRIQEFAE